MGQVSFRSKTISDYADIVYESAHVGAEYIGTNLLELEQKELSNDQKMYIAVEFIYFLLYTTNYRMSYALEANPRGEIMEQLTIYCMNLLLEEHIPHWSEFDKDNFSREFLENLKERTAEYLESDEKREAGETTVASNYVYNFGKEVAKLAGNENNLKVIMIASGLGVDLSAGKEPFEGLKLESFVKSLEITEN